MARMDRIVVRAYALAIAAILVGTAYAAIAGDYFSRVLLFGAFIGASVTLAAVADIRSSRESERRVRGNTT